MMVEQAKLQLCTAAYFDLQSKGKTITEDLALRKIDSRRNQFVFPLG